MLAVVGVVSTGHEHPGNTAESECGTVAAWPWPPRPDEGVASAGELKTAIKAAADTEAATATARALLPAGKRKEEWD